MHDRLNASRSNSTIRTGSCPSTPSVGRAVDSPDGDRWVACPFCARMIEPWLRVGGQINPAGREPIPPGVAWTPVGATLCSWRNRWMAGLLGVTLGPLGVHRMYIGFVRLGVLRMRLTVITFGIVGVWGFVEGDLRLVGVPMRDSDRLPLRS